MGYENENKPDFVGDGCAVSRILVVFQEEAGVLYGDAVGSSNGISALPQQRI